MATGLSPPALLELDDDWLHALRTANSDRWGHVEELLAIIAELAHMQYVAFIRAYAANPPDIDPLRIPRPAERYAKPRTSTVAEIVSFFRGRR